MAITVNSPTTPTIIAKRPARTISRVKSSTISRNADKVNYAGDISGVTNVQDALDSLLLIGATEHLEGERFKFTSESLLGTGYLAEFINDTDTMFAITYDGVVHLTSIEGPAPTAVAGAVCVIRGELYVGEGT